MASEHELQVQQKREVDKKPESTIPARRYLPVTDIFETQDALKVILEMPGVARTASRCASRMMCSPSTAKSTSSNIRG